MFSEPSSEKDHVNSVANVPEISDEELERVEIVLRAVLEKWIAVGRGPALNGTNDANLDEDSFHWDSENDRTMEYALLDERLIDAELLKLWQAALADFRLWRLAIRAPQRQLDVIVYSDAIRVGKSKKGNLLDDIKKWHKVYRKKNTAESLMARQFRWAQEQVLQRLRELELQQFVVLGIIEGYRDTKRRVVWLVYRDDSSERIIRQGGAIAEYGVYRDGTLSRNYPSLSKDSQDDPIEYWLVPSVIDRDEELVEVADREGTVHSTIAVKSLLVDLPRE